MVVNWMHICDEIQQWFAVSVGNKKNLFMHISYAGVDLLGINNKYTIDCWKLRSFHGDLN